MSCRTEATLWGGGGGVGGGQETADVCQEEAQNAALQSSSESMVTQTESCLFITHVICRVLPPAQTTNHLILEMSSTG